MAKKPFPIKSIPPADEGIDHGRIEPPCSLDNLHDPTITSEEFEFLRKFGDEFDDGFYKLEKFKPVEWKYFERFLALGFIGRHRDGKGLFLSKFGRMRIRHGH
jgi:hypothetical protein